MMIHHIHYSSSPGGIELLIPKVVSYLKNLEFSAFVIRPHDPKYINVYQSTNVAIKYGHKRNLITCIKLIIYAFKYRNDIMHVYNIGPFFLLILRVINRRKIIYSIRGTIYWNSELKKRILKTIWKVAISDKIIFLSNSKYSAQIFKEYVSSRNKVTTLYNPLYSNNKYLDKSKKIPENIITVSRLVHGKNLFRLIHLFVAIRKQKPNTKYTVYGDGYLRDDLQKLVVSLMAESYIHFAGYEPNIDRIYQDADLLIFLSEYESFGNVVVESILYGTPVIVSKIPSMVEIFSNYPFFLVQLDDNIDENVLHKINNYDRLVQDTRSAFDEFQVRFSFEQHMSILNSLYSY